MGLPKIKKPSELRELLYGTLDEVCEGQKYLIPTKNGEVMLIQKAEYDLLVNDLELLTEFESPLDLDQLTPHSTVLQKTEKRFGFKRENTVDKKSRK